MCTDNTIYTEMMKIRKCGDNHLACLDFEK